MADQDRDAKDHAAAAQEPQAGAAASPAPAGLSAKGAARRRFARTGAGAAGVLLTLHSKPGMAAVYCGMAPSAAMSAINQKGVTQLSYRGDAPVCSGQTPSWWTLRPWPNSCDPNADFKMFFACGGRTAAYAEVKARVMISGLALCDAGNSGIGRYIMAAFLNAAAGYTSFLSTAMVQQIWNEWSLQGYYEPMAGQKWYASDIVLYLRGTMG